MKLVRLGKIALDGTKIKANASKHKALSHGHITKLEAQLREEVQVLLRKAAEVDGKEDEDGVDLPAEIARRADRLKALEAAKAKIAEGAKARDAETQAHYEAKKAHREAVRGQKAPWSRTPTATNRT